MIQLTGNGYFKWVQAYGRWDESVILVWHNLSIIPPAEPYFGHNTLFSWMTPKA